MRSTSRAAGDRGRKTRQGRRPSRPGTLRGLASGLFIPGFIAGVLAVPGASSPATAGLEPGPAPALSPPLLATPLLSPARVPETLQDLAAARHLDAAVSWAMSAGAIGAGAAANSCAEVSQAGHVLYQDHPTLSVLPASNMKLVTATALLDKLGPSYRFQTSLTVLHKPVRGVVDGDLYFVGGGDPLLRLPNDAPPAPGATVYTNVTRFVALLRAAGVRRVTGSVVGDDTRYDSQRSVPGWPSRYSTEGDVGPLSALGIDDGLATAGGQVPLGAPPAVQSAGVLTDLMRSAGIQVMGQPTAGTVPAGSTLLGRLTSAPLGQILGVVLRESDNTAMELMTKELGLRMKGIGTTAAGVAAVREDLGADGLPLRGFVNVDGSGLARSDRVTCDLLLGVLERAGPDGLLVKDLPVAGRSGTLAEELRGTAAAGRVDAKTGTLDDVKALSGWVEPLPGQGGSNPQLASPVVFATVLNDLAPVLPTPQDTPAGLTDRVALDVAEYPLAPSLGRFEP